MCLLDTTDGALMMALYTSTALARDQIAILYYSTVLTVITIIVAVVIGVIQLLTLIRNVAEPSGNFWDGVEFVEDHYDIIGCAICASFLVFGGISVLVYKPWRRYIDHKREMLIEQGAEGGVERDPLLGDALPGEGFEADIDQDTSLRRPEIGDVESGP